MAVWLLNQFKKMPIKFESSSIKNSNEFVEKIKNVKIAANEEQASFDVEALFPSVPIDTTLDFLRDWLNMNNIHPPKIDELIKLTRICMNENWFQFNGKYYKQNHGCCMGSPLSPFIADLFMSYFEGELKKQGNFPRIWCRYVDDIWVVIKKHMLRQFLHRLNSTKYQTIKFTHEEEDEGKLNFLDLTVIRGEDGFEFDIYRKPTNTGRYITSDSYHPLKHKLAAFHSMIFRALNTPMTNERRENEIQRIKQIAHINGYTELLVNDLVAAHQRKIDLREHTTLALERDDDSLYVWASFRFNAEILPKIKPILHQNFIRVSESSRTRIKDLIGGSKDKIPVKKQSGIYSIECGDCDAEYFGQTKRSIEKRFKEHQYHTRIQDTEKSSVAKHMVDNNHTFELSNLKLIHRVDKFYELNAHESFYIHKNKNNRNLMNENDGPIANSIFTKYYQ